MNILGINFGHDCSACLIVDGKIINAIEEEKISRIKQDFGWPKHAIAILLEHNNLRPADIDIVAFGGFTDKELSRYYIQYCFSKKNKLKEYISRVISYGTGINRFKKSQQATIESEVRKQGFTKAKVEFYDHHLSHAVSAYYPAPVSVDLIITADGYGDGSSFNFYIPVNDEIKLLHHNDHTVSPGLFYSMITKLLGFRAGRHEGKITGLAAYGEATPLLDSFRNLFRYENEKLQRYPFNLAEAWKQFNMHSKLSITEKINLETSEYACGADYNRRAYVLFEKIKELSAGYSKENIAFACQKVTEEIILNEIVDVKKKYELKNNLTIGLAGGVFANVRINQKIYELDFVKQIFIQPAMGDSGLALGAAILSSRNHYSKSNTFSFTHTYLGPDYHESLDSFIQLVNVKLYEVTKMVNSAKPIAELLTKNKIVGFWHGSMEWGPRALGRRSMILNTFDRGVNDVLNKRLNRTEFMPFAPSVIDFMAQTYMPKYIENMPAADYMTITYDVDPKYHDQLQAVVHVDGTARPQIVKKETNPYYYEIIHEFYKLTGCGAIVNTSFNVHEEPIVSSPESAFKALADNRIDYLVLENYLISKRS